MAKNTQPDHVSTATHPGPKPGDFPLTSIESRAAARVRIERLGEEAGPRGGDVFLKIDEPARAAEIIQILRDRRHSADVEAERIPGVPKIWLRFPNGCDPERPGGKRGCCQKLTP